MARTRRSRPLRGQVRAAILAATAGALLVFAVPLAIALRTAYVEQAETVLQREAAAVMGTGKDASTLLNADAAPKSADPTVRITIYAADGSKRSGSGDAKSAVARSVASGGGERTFSEGDMLAAYLPVGDDQEVAVIRAAMDVQTVEDRYMRAWALMGMLGLAILALAYWASGRLARRLSAPLEGLAESAVTLGAGGFGLQVPRTGVQEVDVVGAVLEDSGRRLGERFQRERAFSADASHQLRTPITALRLTLEGAEVDPTADLPTVTGEALTQVDRLERTVEDLLALARDVPTPTAPVWVAEVLDSLRDRYRTALGSRGRSLVVEVGDGLPPAAFPEAALRQILDVLVDNALVHGSGTVTVGARSSGTGVSVVVDDEGDLPDGDVEALFRRRSSAAAGTGIGLALARSLAEAEGARLLASRYETGTRFTLVMAEWEPRLTRERARA
jgi:signal transduction histidine kinase